MPSEQFVNDIFDATEIASTGIGDYLPILRQASGERLLRKIKTTAWSASLTFSVSQITATGTPDNTTVLYGDGRWAVPTVSLTGLLNDRGNFDASGNAFPSSGGSGTAGAILKGNLWTVSIAGTLGGHVVTAGDVVRALADTPGQTDGNWAITENNLGYVAENSANKVTVFSTPTDVQYPSAKLVSDQLALKQSSLTLPLSGTNGGTGIANTGFSITLGGNLVTSGAFNTTITSTATTNSTLPAGTHSLAPLDSPVFTGAPTIPTPFTLGAVSVTATGTELNYVAGVTSAIQTQLNGKQAAGSYVTGTLTPGTVPVATGAGALGDSRFKDDGSDLIDIGDPAGAYLEVSTGGGNVEATAPGAFSASSGLNSLTLSSPNNNDIFEVKIHSGNNGHLVLDGPGNSAAISAATVSLGDVDGVGTRIVIDAAAHTFTVVGNHVFDKTITPSGTTGAQTINLVTGAVNFAAAATSLVVTNSLVDANSVITCTVGTNDTTMKSVACVVASGSFTIYPNAAPTAETRVYFRVSN